ncbi:MAG: peroxidase family protein [Actinomycetota bacterium]
MANLFARMWTASANAIDNRWHWDRLPRPLGIFTLAGLRNLYRQKNLYDTRTTSPTRDAVTKEGRPTNINTRTLEGSYNDLNDPAMGSIGSRFGRNVPIEHTHPERTPDILEPNPRLISRRLLTRDQFIPATTLNVLAGAWLQFEVHDWFSHGKNEPENPWKIELEADDRWPEDPMQIERTRRDPTSDLDSDLPPTFITDDSHWWDGSQIYGSTREFAEKLRAHEDGKLRIDSSGLLPKDLEEGLDLTGAAGNFWIGLGLLHTLFTLEHNSICDRLHGAYPTWSDQQLYDHARLINAALMAKIHTVEWTPGIIAHPTTKLAMNANWWGLMGERFNKRFGRLGSSEILSGIPGAPTKHFGVPYSLTEEFVAVYRMHPLLPDDYTFRSLEDDQVLQERTFREVGALETRTRLEEIGMANALYSFGIAHPGAITLHNYPKFLQTFERPDGTSMDLAAVDIMRTRERGVPRYNEFRRLWHLKPAESFEELTQDAARAEELSRLYGGDIDRLDLMIGLYAEPLPKGFGFSDTAFRVFILMASRRLNSDRFFTIDYTPKVYTQEGIDWIGNTTMIDVLLRHYPQLEPSLRGVQNAFAPWKRVSH